MDWFIIALFFIACVGCFFGGYVVGNLVAVCKSLKEGKGE